MRPIHRVIEDIVSQLPGYEPRPQQIRMAETISEAISGNRHALIEAGTGSGKSFGYLIPLLESGKVAVISTGTIALQEQLLTKDIPFLSQAYGKEIKVAIAKGRSNYVCLNKLEEARRTVPLTDPQRPVLDSLVQISSSRLWNGDRGELPFNIEGRFWADALASDPEDCLGPKCPNWTFTPHRLARAECEEAQIIIANHALYFTDLAREAGILPKHDVVVFDEAHHLDRAAVGALSVQLTRWMNNKLLQRVQRRFSNVPSGLVQDVTEAELGLMDHLYRRGRGQFRIEPEAEFQDHTLKLSEALAQLSEWIGRADPGQMVLLEPDPGMAKERAEVQREQMQSVATDLATRWDHFASLGRDANRANWMYLDPGRDYFELQSAPLDVSEPLRHLLWDKRTCILTSATLAVDGKFEFVKKELGLPQKSLECVLGSPFDYPSQSLLYVPRHLPMPNDPRFLEAVCPEIEQILAMTEGRAFVLCTSYRSLREISGRLIDTLPYPCKTQEDLPRSRLIEWFKSTPHAVLFATATFWEGVDVPGDSLSCVIIDKLPFASPDDPVVQARTDRMKARSEDWFGGYMLPKAILMLKQGFGRLIRTRTDQGLVAILDKRVVTMRYGEVVLRSLPAARRLHDLAQNLEAAFSGPPTGPARKAGSSAARPAPPADWEMGGYSQRNAPPPDLDAVLGEPPP